MTSGQRDEYVRAATQPGNALVFRSFTFGQNVRGPVVELTSVFRKREASRRAVEKARAEFLLDSSDGLRDTGLRQSDFGCRPHNRARLNHLSEYRQTFKMGSFDTYPPSPVTTASSAENPFAHVIAIRDP